MASKDLRQITDDWPYEPGRVSVRRVRGLDNRIKIQTRLDLGLLQMEVEGRPDGRQPNGCESLLEYHKHRVAMHAERNGTDLGFSLDPDECRELREEAVQYYHRYLANFVLEEYDAVIRDTQRNLEALDVCAKYAQEETDRYCMEQYRPYIVMMNARSKAQAAMKKGAYRTALAHVENGLRTIREFFARFHEPKAYRVSGEVQLLKVLRRDIRQHLPVDPILQLKRDLKLALAEERYEDAARLRDELEHILDDPQ